MAEKGRKGSKLWNMKAKYDLFYIILECECFIKAEKVIF